ncbi:SIR2 family NAD-dependent protein deacylase [Lacrimispora brassicae]
MAEKEQILGEIEVCEKLLIGIGEEWKAENIPDIGSLYEKLDRLIKGKDYFIVTTVTDGEIFKSPLEKSRLVAPCGNVTWRQCSKSCTKDIWEPDEIPEDVCPHCNAPLTGNTIELKNYIEEGYLPQWKAYTTWLAGTLNKRLLVLELGVGFKTPTVIRWPFEKTVSINKKAHMYRIHESFSQIPEAVKGKADGVSGNSLEFLRKL